MLKKNSIFSKITIIFLITLFILSNSINVFAISITDNIGSLKIVLEEIEKISEDVDLKLHIYYIKRAVEVGDMVGFEFVEEFEDVSYIDEEFDESNDKYIEELERYIEENKIRGVDFDIDSLKDVGFMEMSLGKYLIVIDNFWANDKEYECIPLLLDIPTEESDGYYNFCITANPKVSEIIKNNNSDNNGDGENNKNNTIRKRLPDTGLPIISAIVLSILGLMLIIIGCALDKRKRKNKK